MEKRRVCIMLACLLSTMIVACILLLAFQFNNRRCELVSLDPERIQQDAKLGWSTKPKRSHDKTLLMRMAAHFEYNLYTKPEGHRTNKSPLAAASTDASTPMPASNLIHSAVNQQPANQSGWSAGPTPNQPAPMGRRTDVQPLAPKSAAAAPVAALEPSATAVGPRLADERFLVVSLVKLDAYRKAGNTTEYQVQLNCSSLRLTFRRHAKGVSLERASAELRPPGAHKVSKCELQLPANSTLFELDLRPRAPNESAPSSGRYACDEPIRLACINRKRPEYGLDAADRLVAHLVISRIEFEMGRDEDSKVGHKFSTNAKLSRCPPTQPALPSLSASASPSQSTSSLATGHQLVKRDAFKKKLKWPAKKLKYLKAKARRH